MTILTTQLFVINNRTYSNISNLLKKDGFEIKGPAVGNRIDGLRTKGYIKRDCSIVDYSLFGAAQMYLMLAKMPDKSGTLLDDFLNAAEKEPDVMEVHETQGQYDYVLKVMVSTLAEANNISKKLAKIGAQIETLAVAESRKNTTSLRIPRSMSA